MHQLVRMRVSLVRSILCLALAPHFAEARMALPRVLNPRAYPSPSGEFVLSVDPSDLYARGSATYQVKRNGVLLWSGDKPFTLYEAGITDKGIIAGYGYTHGLGGFSKERGAGLGEFHVVIMRATGEVIVDEKISRTHSRFLHTHPNPVAKGMLIDGRRNEFVVLVADEDVNRGQDSFWTYQLSSGRLLSKSKSGRNVPIRSDSAEPIAVSFPEFPVEQLTHLGTFTLRETKRVEPSPIRDITEFGFDELGRIGFIRRDTPEQYTFVLITPNGTVLHEGTLPFPRDMSNYWRPNTTRLARRTLGNSCVGSRKWSEGLGLVVRYFY